MVRRPPSRIVTVVVVAVIALGVVVVGLVRAAAFRPPDAPAPIAATRAPGVPVPGAAGPPCGGVPLKAARELRGMWLTTVNNIDFPSRPGLSEAQVKDEYRGWLRLARQQNHNAIFVHVRPSGDAFWPSRYAPWSQWLTGRQDGRDPGWDPMAFMVAEAHAANLEFHAWFNPYRGGQPGPDGPGTDFAKLAPGHPLRQHRDWAVAYPSGRTGRLYFDPGIPAARRFVEDAMLEAVRTYDVDGVHFDDFFYPYPEAGQDFPDDRSFAAYARPGQSRASWRRSNVNALVREMSTRIKQLKPWVKFGISPFGIWRNRTTDPAGSDSSGLESFDAIYADTRTWVRAGWLDYVVPQLYWTIGFAKADYTKVLPWWSDLVRGTKVQLYVGQGDYRVGEAGAWRDPGQLDRQLSLNDRYAVSGSVHFSAKQIRADRLGATTRYRDHHYGAPALIPAMSRLPAAPPSPPAVSAARRTPAGPVALDWRPGPVAPAGWALYRSNGTVAALVATGSAGTPVTDPAPPPGPATYCLTGLDRSANEGPASPPVAVGAA